MNNRFYYAVRLNNGTIDRTFSAVTDDFDHFYALTFSPSCEYEVYDLLVKGKTYAEKKQNLRELAQNIYNAECNFSGNLSLGEWTELNSFFETHSKRYGLTAEFKENGII